MLVIFLPSLKRSERFLLSLPPDLNYRQSTKFRSLPAYELRSAYLVNVYFKDGLSNNFFCCAPSVFLFISDVWQSYGTLCWFVKCQNNLLQLVTETATRGVLSRKVFIKLCKIHRKTSVKKRDSGSGVLL